MAEKIIALSLMSVFYISYFIKMISQKRQGIRTDQLGRGKKGFSKFIEISLKTATYLLIILQIISILLYRENTHRIVQIIGIIIETFGVIAFIASVTEMKDNWRAGVQRQEKTELVTTGIYSVSRNPAFLGFDLMYIGILFAFLNWYLLITTALTVCLFHLQIVNVEEDFLLEAFGEEYLNYKKKSADILEENFG